MWASRLVNLQLTTGIFLFVACALAHTTTEVRPEPSLPLRSNTGICGKSTELDGAGELVELPNTVLTPDRAALLRVKNGTQVRIVAPCMEVVECAVTRLSSLFGLALWPVCTTEMLVLTLTSGALTGSGLGAPDQKAATEVGDRAADRRRTARSAPVLAGTVVVGTSEGICTCNIIIYEHKFRNTA